MSSRAYALGVVGALFALAAGPAAGARLTTRVTVFHAFTATGSPAIKVHHAAGSCFTGSLTASRSDAWRCIVGNYLHDPCFSSTQAAGVVICPSSDPTRGTEIRLTQGLPTAQADSGSPSAASQPWALELFSLAHCSLVSGASSVIHGVRLNYGCAGNTSGGLWGSPRRTTEPWTILSAPFTATTLSHRVAIKHVWT